jgi:cytochrome b
LMYPAISLCGLVYMKKVPVWDLPVRLFHWLLVVVVSTSFITALVPQLQDTALHMQSGYVLLGLILFRVGWGMVGTTYARFGHFLRGPRAVLHYVKRDLLNRADGESSMDNPGHNPLGGWMIAMMLLILLAQIATGLFANDDIMYEGPLAYKLSTDASSFMTAWHKKIYFGTGFLILLHLSAIAFHWYFKKQNLVSPMISGKRWLPDTANSKALEASRTNWWHAISVMLIACALVYMIVEWL